MCLIFDLRYILTQNTLWFGKKATFLTQNILLRIIAGLFRFPPIIIRKNEKKYNFTAGAKLRRKRFSHSKTPKNAPKLAVFGHFLFFLFLKSIFFTLGIKKSLFCSSKCGIKYCNSYDMLRLRWNDLYQREAVPIKMVLINLLRKGTCNVSIGYILSPHI